MFIIDLRNKLVSDSHFSVMDNNNVDTVYIFSHFTQYASGYSVYLKVVDEDRTYVDKITIDSENISIDDNALVVKWTMGRVSTQCKKIYIQLQFENSDGTLVAQSRIAGIVLGDTINVDEEITPIYPTVLEHLQEQIDELFAGSGASCTLSYANDTLTLVLKNAEEEVLGTYTVNIPTLSSIINVSFANKVITFTQRSGSTLTVDLTDFYDKTEVDDLLAEKVDKLDTVNQVYGTDDSGEQVAYTIETDDTGVVARRESGTGQFNVPLEPSDDTHATSKQYVDDNISDVMEVAEGKCETYVLDYTLTLATVKAFGSPFMFYVYNNTTGKWEDKATELKNGDYDDLNIVNHLFNSQDDYITASNDDYIICGENIYAGSAFYLINFGYIVPPYTKRTLSKYLKMGDIILVLQVDVPDRWLSSSYRYRKMETTKVDLTDYFNKNKSAIPSSTNTYDLGSATYNWKDIYLAGSEYFNNSSVNYAIQITEDASGNLVFNSINKNTSYVSQILNLNYNGTFTFYGNALPHSTNAYDLGSSSYKWEDFYLAGNIYGGTFNANFDNIYSTIFNYNEAGTTQIKWSKMLSFSLSANTTFTFETAKTNCLNEYKAIITNSGSSTITLTFTGVSNILVNDDNCVVVNGTNSTLSIPAGTTIECSVVNGKLVAVNFNI